ncbi:hybrid signal transduction histidine kinase D [Apis cerana]|uniref:hybrid signal transduction histidine kinase D n=1 Tax=Apis cerana TaxID=7461 RepID=UPI00109BA181|nr:hybrid signal transduction histidine kinase D [Apis cerana]
MLISMKSSILNTLFILTIAYLIVQVQNKECTCGSLGQGSNPCTSNEVVVKATKLSKPTHYVSPQEIKNAVNAKNSQTDCSNSQSNSNSIPQSNSDSKSNTCGCNENTYNNNNLKTQSESSSTAYSYSGSTNSDNSNESKQNLETLEDSNNFNGNVAPRFSPIGDLCYPLPIEPNSGKLIEKTKVTPAYPGKLICCPPSIPYETCINTAIGKTEITSISDPKSLSTSNSYGNMNFETNSAMYNNLPIFNLNNGNGQKQYSKMSSTSDCFDYITDEIQDHNSYPAAMPADAVSLTLAYKNLRAPNVIYRQGKQFVPEDKLSFGHRTLPTDVKNENQILDVAEEKLVTVNKPVVELKLAPPKTVVIGSYDEQEEAKLAELEAIERESITQEETSNQMSESLITYKDLGYAPVNTNYPKSTSYNQGISNMKIDDSEEEPCGSLGPSRPDYIPGRIIVQEKLFNENMELQTSGSKSCPT